MPQDFSCTTLQLVRLRSEEIWGSDEAFRSEVRPQVAVVNKLINSQTAKVEFFNGGKKKKPEATVTWLEVCGDTVEDNDDSCEFEGDTVSSACKDYDTFIEKKSSLTIDDSDFYNNDEEFVDAVAKGLLKKATDLDNYLETHVISSLDGFAGTNQYTGDSRGEVDGTTTYIKPEYWGSGLMSYFAKVAELNYQSNSFMASGENMFDVYFNSQRNNLNDDQRDQLAKLQAFDWNFDLFNMDSVLGAKKTLMVSPGAAAFVSNHKFVNPDKVPNGANIDRFTFPSPNLPGVTYDVVYRTVCTNGGDDVTHHWKLIARFNVFQSPISSCVEGNTGIISFECGTAPAE